MNVTPQYSITQVQLPLVMLNLTIANVERLVVDQEPDEFAIGNIDDGLS